MRTFVYLALGLIGALTLAVTLVLNTRAGSAWLLKNAQSLLRSRYAVDATFDGGTIDGLHHIEFVNLRLHVDRPDLRADVFVPKITLDYRIHWLTRTLIVESFELIAPEVRAESHLTVGTPPETTSGPSDWLTSPPFNVRLERLRLERLRAEVRQASGLVVSVRDLNLTQNLELDVGRLALRFAFDLGPDGQVAGPDLHAGFGGHGRGDLVYSSQGLVFGPTQLELDLKDVTYAALFVAEALSVRAKARTEADALAADLLVGFKRARLPMQFKAAVDGSVRLGLRGRSDLRDLQVDGDGGLLGETLLKFSGRSFPENANQAFTLTSSLAFNQKLVRRLAAGPPLKLNPNLRASLDAKGSVTPGRDVNADITARVPALTLGPNSAPLALRLRESLRAKSATRHLDSETALEISGRTPGAWRVGSVTSFDLGPELKSRGRTQVTQTRPTPSLEIKAPLKITHAVSRDAQARWSANVEVDAPEVIAPDVGRLTRTHGNFELRPDWEFELRLDQGPIELFHQAEFPRLEGLSIFARGAREGNVLSVPKFQIAVNRTFLNVNGEARVDLARKDLQLKSALEIDVPQNFPEIKGHVIRGRVHVPLNLSVFAGREFQLASTATFRDFSWRNGPLHVSRVNGVLPLNERLRWDGTKLHFAELITENPFERVDFNRVRPLLHGNEQLRIEKLGWYKREYGPFVGFFSVKQNMLSAHQFDLDLLAGKTYGELFVNLYPGNLQLGFLGRLTGLNLTEFLPDEYLSRLDRRTRDLSARAGVVLNLNRATLEGRVDITEIGGRQLLALINVLDPEYRDEKMNRLRSLLQIGYPSVVSAGLAEGFMDLDVDITLLGVSTRQTVHSIPLSGLMVKYTQGLVQAAAKGVLQ